MSSMTDSDDIDDFLDGNLDLYEIVDQTLLDRSKLDTDIPDDDLHEKSRKILSEGPPDSKEEQIGFVLSTLKKQAREDPQGFIEELFDSKKRDLAKRLHPYESYEIDAFKPIFRNIREFSDTDLDTIGEWLNDFHDTDNGRAYSQQYHQVVEERLGRDRKMTVTDIDSLNEAVDLYSDLMNICDAGYAIPVALHRVVSGDDPREKNLTSMGLSKGLQELEGTDFAAIPNHVDIGLRHGIKHGDMLIDPRKEELRIEDGGKKFSLIDLGTTVNDALLTVDVIEATKTYISMVDYRRNFEFLNQ